jgi:hypothetical protein
LRPEYSREWANHPILYLTEVGAPGRLSAGGLAAGAEKYFSEELKTLAMFFYM